VSDADEGYLTWGDPGTDPPPSAGAPWYDPAVTQANVLATLRLSPASADAALIAAKIPAAAKVIEQHLDRLTPLTGPPPDPALQEILEGVTIRLYHRTAIVATIGSGVSALEPPSGEPFDPLADFYVELAAFREGWAVA
jgi:hypothetical protein